MFEPRDPVAYASLKSWRTVGPFHLLRSRDQGVNLCFFGSNTLASVDPGILWWRTGRECIYYPVYDLRCIKKNIKAAVHSLNIMYPSDPLVVDVPFMLFAASEVGLLHSISLLDSNTTFTHSQFIVLHPDA